MVAILRLSCIENTSDKGTKGYVRLDEGGYARGVESQGRGESKQRERTGVRLGLC